MKGDFTRFSHQPGHHYAAVLMQQGRVTLDADWNEQAEVEDHRWRVQTIDTIGRACAPVHDAGFGLSFTPDGEDLVIGEGRIYVDGILVENKHGVWVDAVVIDPRALAPADLSPGGRAWETGQWVELRWTEAGAGDGSGIARVEEVDDGSVIVAHFGDVPPDTAELQVRRLTTYLTQPFFPASAPLPFGDPFDPGAWDGLRHLLYLDVWRRHVTAVEDPHIREVALGGPDTATRVQTAWAVRILFAEDEERVPFDASDIDCNDPVPRWDDVTSGSGGRMSARAQAAVDPDDPCLITPDAGYRGLENRLYRVEIHDPGPLGAATYKWSRDNGSLLSAIVGFPANDEVELHSLGRDRVLRFHADNHVEVLSDESELSGQPGTLAAIAGQPDEAARRITLDTDVSLYADHQTPRLRRWDQPGDVVATSGTWTDLEDGVQVRFEGGPFLVGDYWVVPARVATGDVEGFADQPPRGIDHHFARLALVTWSSGIDDCRHTFRPLCEAPTGGGEGCATATVGDGVTSVGDFDDIQAAIESVPPGGPGRVTILPGDYALAEPLLVRHQRLTIGGCGAQTRLVAAEGAVIRVQASNEVRIEWLHMESRANEATVTIDESRHVTVERCTIVNGEADDDFEPSSDPVGPAVAADASADVRVVSCRVLGAPALSLQSTGIGVVGNLARGTVWVRDGSRHAVIGGNDISNAPGPGVALGGLRRFERPSRRFTGVRRVEVTHNHIQAMSNSGVTTVSYRPPLLDITDINVLAANLEPRRPLDHRSVVASFNAPSDRIAAIDYVATQPIDQDDLGFVAARAIGDVTDVTISDNLIADCGNAGVDPAYERDAVGGVVLRDVIRAAIHRNEIVRNAVRGCGIFLHGCEAVEITDNRLADNGKSGGRFVDFTTTVDPEGPNPLVVDGFRFQLAGTQSSRILLLLGLLVPESATITVPEPTDAVDVTFRSTGDVRVAALTAAGVEVASRRFGGGLHTAELEGDAIASVRIAPVGESEGAFILSVCAGSACRTYQAGIVGVGLSPAGEQGEFAIRVHDNLVDAPAGQALVLSGVGSMSVADNHLTSQGRTLQARGLGKLLSGRLPVEFLPRAVFVFNAGRATEFGNRSGFPLADNLGRLRAREPSDGAFPAVVDDGEQDGRTLFHGNQVVYRPDPRGDELEFVPVSVGLASFDDVAVLDNQMAVEGGHTFTFVDMIAMGVTIRVADNRWSEPVRRAMWSAVVVGFWLAQAIGNQATHCIAVNGVLDELVANQILVEHLAQVRCQDRQFQAGATPTIFSFTEG